MRNNNNYRYLVMGMFFMILLFGVYVGCRYIIKFSGTDKVREETVSVVNNEEDEQDEVIIYDKEEITDITVIYEDYYSLCSETVRKEDYEYSTTLEKVKEAELEKQKNQNLDYSIVEENDDTLVFKRTIEANCPNHYRIILENTGVVVYNRINDKELEMYRKINIPEELIREELKERLKKGVDVNSKEELNLFVEDLES